MCAEVACDEGAYELDRSTRYLHILRTEGRVAEGFDDDRREGGDGCVGY